MVRIDMMRGMPNLKMHLTDIKQSTRHSYVVNSSMQWKDKYNSKSKLKYLEQAYKKL